jgi:hypothetical protein
MVTYIEPMITLEALCREMRDICKFSLDQNFTMKWVDEEGIHHIISSLIHIIFITFFISISFLITFKPKSRSLLVYFYFVMF